MKPGLRARLGYVDRRDWGWVHFKFAVGLLWPALILIAAPLARNRDTAVSPGLVYAWMACCIVGALLSIFGIIARAQPEARHVLRGTAAELGGLILMFTGPFMLFILYIGLAVKFGEPRYLTGLGLCYALSAVMVARWLEVLPKRRGRK